MPEDGPIAEVETQQYSAKNFIKIAPKSATVEANQDQNVRLLIRKPANLEDGEYRSHLKVTMVNDNVEASNSGEAKNKDLSVVIKPTLSLVIPVIIRHGQTNFQSGIEDIIFRNINDESGKTIYFADILLTRSGNRSSMGDIEIIQEIDGKREVVKFMAGVPVYRPGLKRKISIQIDKPISGNFTVIYKSQEKDGGAILAEKSFSK